jgi:hypothetical protein
VIRFALLSLIQPVLYKSRSSYHSRNLAGLPPRYFTYLISLAKKLACISVEFPPFRKGLDKNAVKHEVLTPPRETQVHGV